MRPNSKLILPEPTYAPPDRTKKSHARKQPAGHIPRPRNAFILFRCDFVRQKKIPESVESDHRNISRIVGRIWREMTELEKEAWVKMAEMEKANHLKSHPGYRFTRGSPGGKRKTKRKEGGDRLKDDSPASLPPSPKRYPIPDIDVPPEWENSSPAGPWHAWIQDSDYQLGGPPNNAEDYLGSSQQNTAPEFANPFAVPSTLPPLPRSDLAFDFEDDLHLGRKESSRFSPRTRTWKLPRPPLDFAELDPSGAERDYITDACAEEAPAESAFHPRLLHLRRSRLNSRDNTSPEAQHAREVADEIVQELSHQWLTDTPNDAEN